MGHPDLFVRCGPRAMKIEGIPLWYAVGWVRRVTDSIERIALLC